MLLLKLFFGWRLLLLKLPTRVALNHRGIITNPHDIPCIFCFKDNEDCSHLFFHWGFVKGVWEAIFRWLGHRLPIGLAGWDHSLSFGTLFKSKNGNHVRHLIWLATTWSIWKLRNNVTFNGDLPNVPQLLDNVKAISWIWFSGGSGRKSFLSFSNWCFAPIACIQSL
jgi:hypothetical protein